MLRRDKLSRRAALFGICASATRAFGQPVVSADRLSVLNDEVADDLAGAIRFAHEFGLKWLELRQQAPGKRNYYQAPLSEVKEAARMLRDAGVGVSFLNTRFLKFHYPGSEGEAIPAPELFEAYKRYDLSPQKLLEDTPREVSECVERAHILGTSKIRVFAFVRVRKPSAFLPRVAEVIAPLVETARRGGCQLLLENEHTTNVVTGEEIASLLSLVPGEGFGLNWDPHNALSFESPYPEGYAKLPKSRIGNVQVKARSLLTVEERMDWARAAADLHRDGYRGFFGLEPHMGSGAESLANAKRAMAELRRTFGLS